MFLAGTLLGISLTLCLAATTKEAAPPQSEPARIQVVTYQSGITGFFDPATCRLYLYDSELRNCFAVHQISRLGRPLTKE